MLEKYKNISDRKISYLIFAVYSLIYLLSLVNVISITHDSITYSNEIEAGIYTWHPHHVLYHVFSLFWYKLMIFLGIPGEGHQLIASLNSIFGAGTLVVIYNIFRNKFDIEKLNSILFTAIISFSFGFWFYSAVVEVYIIPLFFLILSVYLFPKSLSDRRAIYLSALSAGIAVLFHQVHVLFGASVILYIFFKKNEIFPDRTRSIFRFGIVFSLTFGVPYILIILFAVDANNMGDIAYWLTKYNYEVNSWNTIGPSIIAKDFIGFSRAFISPHALFSIDSVQEFLAWLFPSKHFADEIFLVRNFSKYEMMIYILMLTTFTVSFVILMFKVLINIKKIKYLDFGLYISFFSVYFIFFSFWDSANVEFWIPQSVIVWIVLLVGYEKCGGRRSGLSIPQVLLVSLFIVNFYFAVRPAKDISNDYYYNKTMAMKEELTSHDIILMKDTWIIKDYFDKYLDNEIFVTDNVAWFLQTKAIAGRVFVQSAIRGTILSVNDSINSDSINSDSINIAGDTWFVINPDTVNPDTVNPDTILLKRN